MPDRFGAMRTRVVTVDPDQGPWPALEGLARVIDDGGLVAIPTETVYGIAVNLRDEAALRRLEQLRGRAATGPPTVHLPDAEALFRSLRHPPVAVRKLADRFWPGPLTIVVSDRHGRPTGYRVPDLAVTRALLGLSHAEARIGAVAAVAEESASAVTADQVLAHFDGVLDAVLDGGPCRHGAPSSVARVFPAGDVEILHIGVVPGAEIREAAARTILFVCSANRCRSPLAAALATRLLAQREGVDEWDLLSAGFRVESAGTGCLHGAPATPEAEAAATARGLDLAQHRARPLTHAILEQADEIFVMTRAQRESIVEFVPEARGRIQTLDREGRDVPDPYGRGTAAYEQVTEAIRAALKVRLDEL